MIANTRKLAGVAPSAVRASDPFKRYKREKLQIVRKADIKEDNILKQLKQAFRQFHLSYEDNRIWASAYERASVVVKRINYSARDVEKFSLILYELKDERYFALKAGIFLSALINNGVDIDYVLHVNPEHKILAIGLLNIKNLIINNL